MSDPDDTLQKTQEFIADAQDIIAKTNELMAALNKLSGKNSVTREWDPKQLAQHSRLEEDLETLLQRYFSEAVGSSGVSAPEAGASSSQNNAAVRPGRFRSRI